MKTTFIAKRSGASPPQSTCRRGSASRICKNRAGTHGSTEKRIKKLCIDKAFVLSGIMTSSLCGNRFAVLAPDSDSERAETPPSPKPLHCTTAYSLTLGNQPVTQRYRTVQVAAQPASQPSNSASLSSSTSMPALSAISFFGRCFQCQYMSHSQKYCPLRQCKLCRTYGHSEIVCHKLQPHAQKSSTRGFFSRGPESGAGFPPGFSPEATSSTKGGGLGGRTPDG